MNTQEDTVNTFKNLIIDIYDGLNISNPYLINISYKINDYREIVTLLQEYSRNKKYDWNMILYLFNGELPFHPIFKLNIQNLGLFSIKYLIEKSRESLSKELTIEDFIFMINYKEEENKKLHSKIEIYENMLKLQSNTITELIKTPTVSPTNKIGEHLYNGNYEYNPFTNNIWK